MLYVTSQSKIWRLRSFYMGKEQNLTLGKYPLMSFKEAWEANFALRQQLDKGWNHAKAKKAKQVEQLAAFIEERRIARGENPPRQIWSQS